MSNYKLNKEILGIIFRIINKGEYVLHEPRYYGTDEILFASEIHLLEAIGNNPDFNQTELAEYLGITKGALPKIIQKLIKKNLLSLCYRNNNKKEKKFMLTTCGKKAYYEHKKFHENMDIGMIENMNTFSDIEKKKMKEFLMNIDKYLDTLMCN